MRTIWKFPLQLIDTQTIELPADYKILSVMNQNGTLVLYAEVTAWEDSQKLDVPIAIYGTGHRMPENPGTFIGTVTTHNDELVWHVYHTGYAKFDV